jgi:RNA 3'-terminal phosphate cyclase (ATP)
MALAKGTSRILTGCLTLHTQTAIDVAQQLVPSVKFDVQRVAGGKTTKIASDKYGKDGMVYGTHLITCHGIGWTPSSVKSSQS